MVGVTAVFELQQTAWLPRSNFKQKATVKRGDWAFLWRIEKKQFQRYHDVVFC
jgi:hypothetical protein